MPGGGDLVARVQVLVQAVIGSYAQVVIPSYRWTPQNPLLVPVSEITNGTGLPREALPGKTFLADVTETRREGTLVSAYTFLEP
jgi:hypothetical protein